MSTFAVVADIGGTNARFSRINLTTFELDRIQVFACADYPTLGDVLNAYSDEQEVPLEHVAIAIACPVDADEIDMTNHHWKFSVRGVKKAMSLKTFIVLNDFAAAAMSVVTLKPHELKQIGGGKIAPKAPKAILGAGTGLGVGHLITLPDGSAIPLPGEGGHVDWAPTNEKEWAIHRYIHNRFGRVSAERVLSGPGLETLYLALADYHGKNVNNLSAAEIGKRALSGNDTLALEAVNQFFASLGTFAGNLALNLNTYGGVYIAGGVVPKLMNLLATSNFRARFEHKGRFCKVAEAIPCFVITAEHAGLRGVGQYLKQQLQEKKQQMGEL
ncbi:MULTISPECIES: glucokinase [Gammaproteobacteria]|uniref:glucokinase n=1 Tax=Gammaproteobacteria TaxID=1236 RepID=UPI000DD0A970|nr:MULTISPECIES: glucokinase [Gammaproteobacteria]RTE86280.1 glucokinase [Aliidiomarina sp. B3213]TCZ91631.1 glucokinase [Lysobacter sp. N42]